MALRGKARLFDFTIVSNSSVAEDTYKAILSAPGLADVLEPGQFVNVRVPGDTTHILRIPCPSRTLIALMRHLSSSTPR